MQYRRLGSSGLQLSALSFGAWVTFGNQVGRGAARELIAAAWDHGINFFDNAEAYANGEAERVMGDVLADLRLPRDGWCVSSKVFFGAVDGPAADAEGPVAQARARCLPRRAEAPARGLPRPVLLPSPRSRHADRGNRVGDGHADPPGQGAVLGHVGMAGAGRSARRTRSRARTTCIAPTMEQPQYNLLHRERVEVEYAPLYAEFGMGTTIWSPLASGLLTGKYNDGVPADSRLGAGGLRWLQRGVLGDPRIAPRRTRAQVHRRWRSELGVRAGAAGDRLVPAQPACVDGDARRDAQRSSCCRTSKRSNWSSASTMRRGRGWKPRPR